MGIWGRGQKFSACSQNIAGQIIPSAPSHSRISRRHQLLSPNPLILFNSPSSATAQKPLPPIRHICGLGASVGCERVERTFNAPRLKSQICLIGGNGFVCSLSNELNSNLTNFIFGDIIGREFVKIVRGIQMMQKLKEENYPVRILVYIFGLFIVYLHLDGLVQLVLVQLLQLFL